MPKRKEVEKKTVKETPRERVRRLKEEKDTEKE